MRKYDYLLVGSGLFSCVFTALAKQNKKTCLIIEKRNYPFGNCYSEEKDNIHIHMYGPHVFHTNDHRLWNFMQKFAEFNNFIYKPKVNYNNRIYSFPINLMTLCQIWNVVTPEQALSRLEEARVKIDNPQNLEEWALSQVGEELYRTFIYGYTKKQWNTDPKNLPKFIIQRLPIRLYFEENYFFDRYQGIPINGYSDMLQNMIEDTEVILNTDYFQNRDYWNNKANQVVYTGCIDEYFEFEYGQLNYRSLNFTHEKLEILDFQGNAAINYTSENVPYTRVIEHKHFLFDTKSPYTYISKEYPANYEDTKVPYYPINNDTNNEIYQKYHKLSLSQNKTIFGGRLAQYKYYNMDQIVASAHHIYNKFS